MKRSACLIMVAASAVLLASCQTQPQDEVQASVLYEKYDEQVTDLRRAVSRGDLTVSEAESLRKEAFRDYLEEVKEHQIDQEFRNY